MTWGIFALVHGLSQFLTIIVHMNDHVYKKRGRSNFKDLSLFTSLQIFNLMVIFDYRS